MSDEVSLYDRDFATWARQMAQIVTEGRWEDLDRENVAEELASIARQELRLAEYKIEWIVMQLLRWSAYPERRCGRWKASILRKRFDLEQILEMSPSLNTAEMIAERWPWVIEKFMFIRRMDQNPYPDGCPFTIEQILDGDFWPS